MVDIQAAVTRVAVARAVGSAIRHLTSADLMNTTRAMMKSLINRLLHPPHQALLRPLHAHQLVYRLEHQRRSLQLLRLKKSTFSDFWMTILVLPPPFRPRLHMQKRHFPLSQLRR